MDAIRLYKPRREVYAMVLDAISVSEGDVALISSNRWDVMGAVEFGFAGVWVNRAKLPDEYPDHQPHRIIDGLAALPALEF